MQGICYRNSVPVTITEYYKSLKYFKHRLIGTNPGNSPNKNKTLLSIFSQTFSSFLPSKLRTAFQIFK